MPSGPKIDCENYNFCFHGKAGANCLKCMQLQMCAVVRQVYAVVIAVAVVAALSHHLQLYLQLCLA